MLLKTTLQKLLLFILSGGTFLTGYAQYTIIGQNSFWGSNTYGPMTTNTTQGDYYNRHAYIYPSTTLGVLEHGDTIRSLEFYKSSAVGFLGTPEFRIYMNNSILADFGSGNLNWENRRARSGTVKVYDADPTSASEGPTGWKRFTLHTPYVFDTSKGHNLEILVEFVQDTVHTIPVTWVYENDMTVPAFISNDETKFVFGTGTRSATTNNSNLRKPYLKINFFRYRVNLSTEIVYALGRVPILMGSPDTVRALVSNAGLDTVRNHPVYLKVSGANHLLDSTSIPEIPPFATRMVKFSHHQPDTLGRERLSVYLGRDGYPDDDTAFVDRLVNYNVYSHADPFSSMAGGIGFQGSSGDFVARFHSDSISYINQVQVEFGVRQGLPFQIGIWEPDSLGLPGKNIFSSDTLRSVIGNYILPVLPRVQVTGDFFVGLRQTDTNNIAFSYQPETPVRPDAFYFTAPLGNNDWTPFSPGFDFKFNIQPRIQVAHDVGVLRIEYPAVNDTVEYDQFDSIAPVATIVNYGFNDLKAPFDVVCEIINSSSSVVYRSKRTITLKSNDSLRITFDTSFSRNNLGRFIVRVYCQLSGDLIKDNDTLLSAFDVVIRYDMAVERFFDPLNGAEYEMNRDSIWPIVRVANNGILNQRNVQLTLQLTQAGQLLKEQKRQFSLGGKESLILDFDTITLSREGIIYFMAFLSGHVDSFPSNDTAIIFVKSVKANDIGITKINRPINNQRFERGSRFQPFVEIRNHGLRDQDSFLILAQIRNDKGALLYSDSNWHSLAKYSTTQSIFKFFDLPLEPGTYQFITIARVKGDQESGNDTLRSRFFGVFARDIQMLAPISPAQDLKYPLNDPIELRFALLNAGLNDFTDSVGIYAEISDLSTGHTKYIDSMMVQQTIRPDSQWVFSFPASWLSTEKGGFRLRVYAAWPDDQRRLNDTSMSIFHVLPALNGALLSILEPDPTMPYEMNRGLILPKVSIRNEGYLTFPDSALLGIRIMYNGNLRHEELLKVSSPGVDSSSVVHFSKVYQPDEFGSFDVLAWIEVNGDEYPSDDSVRAKFNSAKSDDVGIMEIIEPRNNSTVAMNKRLQLSAIASSYGQKSNSDSFPLHYEIWKEGSMVFKSDRKARLDSGQTLEILFDSLFFPRETGNYETIVYTQFPEDQDRRNDTLRGAFKADFGLAIDDAWPWGLNIYPNPARIGLFLEQDEMRFSHYAWMDASGRSMEQGQIAYKEQFLPRPTFASGGLYILRLRNGQEILHFKVLFY